MAIRGMLHHKRTGTMAARATLSLTSTPCAPLAGTSIPSMSTWMGTVSGSDNAPRGRSGRSMGTTTSQLFHRRCYPTRDRLIHITLSVTRSKLAVSGSF